MKAKWIIIGVVIVAGVAAGGWWVLRSRAQEQPRTFAVARTDVVQEVDFTGRLAAREKADLGFETIGVAVSVPVVGDAVQAGQTLVVLDARLAQLELAKARAQRANVQDETGAALAAAIEEYTDTKLVETRTLEAYRQAVRDTKRELDQSRELFQQVVRENDSESSTYQSQLLSLLSDEKIYHSAQQDLAQVEAQVARNINEARSQVVAAEAKQAATVQASRTDTGLAAAEATEELASVRLQKGNLTAPFDGVVTAVAVQPGEVVQAGQAVVTVQTVDALEVVADVAEADMAKLAVGMSATIRLDAYGSTETWQAEVVQIDPAAVLADSVPQYQVTLRLLESDPRFRPGLTADITVHAAEQQAVLAVPRRAIVSRNGEQFVTVLTAQGAEMERMVTTGLAGSDALVEITSGLQEGDLVVIAASE